MQGVLPDDGETPRRNVRATAVNHQDPWQQILEDKENGSLCLAMQRLRDLLQTRVGVEG